MFTSVIMQAQEKQNFIIDSLPENLQNQLSVPITYLDENLTLELEKNSVFGANTRFLIDDGTGKLIEIDKGLECTYRGYVTEYPNYTVSAVMTNEGLIASINRPGKSIIEIRPSAKNKRDHEIFSVEKVHSNELSCHVNNNSIEENGLDTLKLIDNQNNLKLSNTDDLIPSEEPTTPNHSNLMAASLRPTTVMEVREFEIGVEIGSRAFFASTAYNGNLATAQASAQSIIGNLNARFLRGAGVKHTLGTVIIRTNSSTDPLRDLVTSTGGSTNSSSSLAAFRDYWNNNPGEVGNTHDIAVYHVLSAPSGLAYVNSIGTRNRYATMGGNAATSWANGTAAHEVGHSWSLAHNNSSGIFYEARPRDNAGATSAGGNDYFVSIMNGSGRHNIGRLATNEARRVINVRKAKSAVGTLNRNPGPIPPFGAYDNFTINGPTSSGTFDVIANDYDANNDVLDVRLLDRVSNKGGRISISAGTGPGGRNQIRYSPPSSGLSGEDFFHYTVFDRSGRTDFGAVYVKVAPSSTINVNLNATVYNYDLGTPTSPVQNGWTRISDKTIGDVNWSGNVESRDRGNSSGVNAINRDLIQSNGKRVLRHKIKNGVWSVVMNLGDANFRHDNMSVKAEGRTIGNNITSQANTFPYVRAEEIEVRDGVLDIEISDNGGSDPNWVWTRLSLTRVRDLPQVITNGTYVIRAKHSNKNIDVANISTANGANVHQWSPNGKDNQRWVIKDIGSGFFTIKAKHSNKFMDIKDASNARGANLQVWGNAVNTQTHRQFKFIPRGGVYFSIQSRKSGKCLDVESRSTANGANIYQWDCNSTSDNQQFRFISTPNSLSRDSETFAEANTKLYPNPVKDILNLSFSEHTRKSKSVLIYNSMGSKLKTIKVSNDNESIDVSRLPSGIYYLRIIGDNDLIIKNIPFVKE